MVSDARLLRRAVFHRVGAADFKQAHVALAAIQIPRQRVRHADQALLNAAAKHPRPADWRRARVSTPAARKSASSSSFTSGMVTIS